MTVANCWWLWVIIMQCYCLGLLIIHHYSNCRVNAKLIEKKNKTPHCNVSLNCCDYDSDCFYTGLFLLLGQNILPQRHPQRWHRPPYPQRAANADSSLSTISMRSWWRRSDGMRIVKGRFRALTTQWFYHWYYNRTWKLINTYAYTYIYILINIYIYVYIYIQNIYIYISLQKHTDGICQTWLNICRQNGTHVSLTTKESGSCRCSYICRPKLGWIGRLWHQPDKG